MNEKFLCPDLSFCNLTTSHISLCYICCFRGLRCNSIVKLLAEFKRLVLFLWTTVILILLFYCFDMNYLMNGYVHHRTSLSTSYEFTSHLVLVLVLVVVGYFFVFVFGIGANFACGCSCDTDKFVKKQHDHWTWLDFVIILCMHSDKACWSWLNFNVKLLKSYKNNDIQSDILFFCFFVFLYHILQQIDLSIIHEFYLTWTMTNGS